MLAQLSATGASYSIHPLHRLNERSLRPSEMSIHQVPSTAVTWIFDLRRQRRTSWISGAGPSTIPAQKRHRGLRPRHQSNAITASWSAQPGRHGTTATDRGEANVPGTLFAGLGSPPAFEFTLSASMPGHQITAEMRSLSTQPGRRMESPSDRDERHKAFSSLVGWQASSDSTDASPWDPPCKPKLLTNAVAESKASWAVVKRWPAKGGEGARV